MWLLWTNIPQTAYKNKNQESMILYFCEESSEKIIPDFTKNQWILDLYDFLEGIEFLNKNFRNW